MGIAMVPNRISSKIQIPSLVLPIVSCLDMSIDFVYELYRQTMKCPRLSEIWALDCGSGWDLIRNSSQNLISLYTVIRISRIALHMFIRVIPWKARQMREVVLNRLSRQTSGSHRLELNANASGVFIRRDSGRFNSHQRPFHWTKSENKTKTKTDLTIYFFRR